MRRRWRDFAACCRQRLASAMKTFQSQGLRLHDAQSCIAREQGFASWPDLKRYVEVQAVAQRTRRSRPALGSTDLSGDVSNTVGRTNLRVGLRILADDPASIAGDPYLACAIGDEDTLRQATEADPAWVDLSGGPLQIATAFCRRAFGPAARGRVSRTPARSARLLIAAGADVNQRIHSRWPPGSLSSPTRAIRSPRCMAPPVANHDPS